MNGSRDKREGWRIQPDDPEGLIAAALFGLPKVKQSQDETPGRAGQADRGILVFENTSEIIRHIPKALRQAIDESSPA